MAENPMVRVRGDSQAVALPATGRVAVQTARRLVPGGGRTSGGETRLAADEVLRVTLTNGFALWIRADDLVRERGHQTATRGGAIDWDTAWELDTRPPAQAHGATRGGWGLGVSILDCFDVDLKDQRIRTLGERLEEHQLQGQLPGLYHCALGDTFALTPVTAETPIVVDQGPLLVFIHGTGSSCRGSFGALWAGSTAATAAREDLSRRYGTRALAWEHRSLTESPIVNALELVRALPAGAQLHLVTHSRGGLVGELLCLGERDRATDPLQPHLLDTLFAADHTLAAQLGLNPLAAAAGAERDQAYQADRAALTELLTLLAAAPPRISRFVRVACPARGTTLASGRLDRWLSVLAQLAGWTLTDATMDFLLAAVKARTDPRTLPGLEAMMPGSALTRLLQHPDLMTRADLTVIAGDAQGDALWGQLKLFVADWFYGSDHDLVVNTGSMAGGLRRPPGGARLLRDQGPEVNHFGYFRNERSLRWLTAALARAEGTDAGFQPIERAPREAPRWRETVRRARSAGTPKPLAVLVPGMMGSTLAVDGRTLWLDDEALRRGGIARLRLNRTDHVEPIGPLDARYGPLIAFLARSHRIEVFPYDWRRSILDTAQVLTEHLDAWLPEAERTRQPVRLIAHSLGGLVVRAMIGDGGTGAALWRRIIALPESRLLMLGTPHQGTCEALRWLTGRHPTLTRLSLLDLTQGPDVLVDILRAYPALLELLPGAPPGPDLLRMDAWNDLKQTLHADWNPPTAAALRQARATWSRLRDSPVDPRHMVAVAGHQAATIADYRLQPADPSDPAAAGRLDFLATAQGDGSVTWRSGHLPQVPLWYVGDTAHDALCTRQAAFPGYLDLLMTGTTTRLTQTPPGAARAGAADDSDAGEALFPLPAPPPTDDIPDQYAVESFGFGSSPSTDDTGDAPAAPAIQVCIRHGDLSYARYPVLVGHYLGDTIVSAELALDERLAGRLSECLQLGLYPGRAGSSALFINERPRAMPAGAVVVGLGQVGELTPVSLETGVRDALLDFALRVVRWSSDRFGAPDAVRSAAFTALLVGSGAGGLRAADVVKAILRGALAAADRLAATGLNNRVALDHIEIIELYQDLALVAAEALEEVLQDDQLAARLVWQPRVVEEGVGGLRRVRCEEAPEWWQRLEITQEPRGEALRFIAATDRARAEVTLAAGQLRLADTFIAQASRSPATNAEAAKTLFEMLLPTRLRELAPKQRHLVVLVDEVSARFPWELLEDRWSHTGRPPAVSGGLVRQLKTPNYRSHIAHAQEAKAYVVGNPDLDGWNAFTDLPGAREEAGRVAQLLRDHGFQVTDRIDEKADAILNGLHKDAWRILHLAGHGEHEFPLAGRAVDTCPACGQTPTAVAQRISGMVIGKETFLTPGDVEQLRWVPELVFINCCHLGKTQTTAPTRFHHLAANLALQFINMGVKAVIAAGWAVDDRAGLAFAEGFYARMLAGQPFGESVRAAREEVWQRFADVNTWGAYQCYGDPAYRLRVVPAPAAAPTRRPYHAPLEVIADLGNLSEYIRTRVRERDADPAILSALRTRIEDLIGAIPQAQRDPWLARADLAAAIGFAWGETGAYQEAVTWLETALGAETGDCSLRTLEQCSDFGVRLIGEQWRTLRHEPAGHHKEDRRQDLIGRIEQYILELAAVSQRAPTAERLTLLGQACRQLAWLQTEPRGRLEALANMAHYLARASAESTRPDPCPFALWAAAKLLARWLDATCGGDWEASLPDRLQAMIDLAAARNTQEPSFRHGAAEADNATVLLLTQASPSAAAVERIIALYRELFRRGASPREVASVHETLDFLIAIVGELPTPLPQVLAALTAIREAL